MSSSPNPFVTFSSSGKAATHRTLVRAEASTPHPPARLYFDDGETLLLIAVSALGGTWAYRVSDSEVASLLRVNAR